VGWGRVGGSADRENPHPDPGSPSKPAPREGGRRPPNPPCRPPLPPQLPIVLSPDRSPGKGEGAALSS
jgi:hypothetical protein